MQFRWKVTIAMIALMSLLFGIGGTMLIAASFEDSLDQEIQTDLSSYQLLLNTLLVINENSDWASREELSSTFLSLMRENQKETAATLEGVYSKPVIFGKDVSFFEDLTKETSPTKLSYRIVSPSKHGVFDIHATDFFLQVCGSFQMNEETFYLTMCYDLAPVYQTHAKQQSTFFRIFLILIGACTLFCYGMVLFLTRPLMRLLRTTRRISSGDYSCRSTISSRDEIGMLSESFNQMTDSLVNHMEELAASMERQNTFVGNFTHELKTPMTSIIGYADLLRSETLTGEEARDAANYIFSEGKRLEHLSIKLLDLFVTQENEITLLPSQPSLLLASLLSHLQPEYLSCGIELTYDCMEGSCMLEPDYFISLTRNLLENAKRAIVPDSGHIHLSLSLTTTGCMLQVADDGRGIPPESLDCLTDAFYRVDKARSRAQGGAGLGLALCERIARLHHGTIAFSSEVGNGTTVTVTLNGGLL